MLKQRAQTTKPTLENHNELPLHTCKLPLNQCNSPWTNACEPPHETEQLHQLSSHGQTGHPHRSDRWTRSPSTCELHWSDRCPTLVRPMPPEKLQELKNSSKPLGNLLNACCKPFQAQTSPHCWQCMNQAKNAKIQPRASQIDKIQHRMLHMSKWAS
jgi:hypothetical protein